MALDVDRRKELLRLVPEGSLVSRSRLIEQGFSISAIDNFVKSRQLETVKGGIYKREGTPVSWEAIVHFLQNQKASDLVVGGLSALELQQLSHYIPLNNQKTVHLYGADTLPNWIDVVPEVQFQKHSIATLLGYQPDQEACERLATFTKKTSTGNLQGGLAVSTPERAILEVLNEVPAKIGFEHAFELLQGLTSLSPRALQQLLELYHNFKVRRLFFWYAEKLNYPWLNRIDRSKIGLGSGNRVIVKGGKLDKKYLITIPEGYE